jgi:hypothetical protein
VDGDPGVALWLIDHAAIDYAAPVSIEARELLPTRAGDLQRAVVALTEAAAR